MVLDLSPPTRQRCNSTHQGFHPSTHKKLRHEEGKASGFLCISHIQPARAGMRCSQRKCSASSLNSGVTSHCLYRLSSFSRVSSWRVSYGGQRSTGSLSPTGKPDVSERMCCSLVLSKMERVPPSDVRGGPAWVTSEEKKYA